MRFTEQWLREWVDPALATQALADQLTLAGLEVDAIAAVAPAFDRIVVGHVLHLEQHPNADKLKVARVDVGSGEPLQIVCGAVNVAVGQRVPAALVGAVLPGDKKIEKAKLRGVESFGMLCSAVELGIAETSTGLLVLPSDAPVGVSVRDYLQLDDKMIELGVTPNRGDCLSVRGIAREVAVLNELPLTEPPADAVTARGARTFPVASEAPECCPRYLGRVIENINPHAATPLWMQERLRRCGLRSIHPVVDVTNFILIELGQPMHAFDLAKLHGGIVVRLARDGETLTLLDGQTIELDRRTLVIADQRGPVALAGIMGGQNSAVSDATTSLFLESAFFTPAVMAGRARHYRLSTESARRFERGVDPELPRQALERATALLIDIVGGAAGPVVEVVKSNHLPRRNAIVLRGARITRMLGTSISAQDIRSILERLGMVVAGAGDDQWHVTPPSWRFDVSIEADLIEEIARVYGYGRLPSQPPLAGLTLPSGERRVVGDARVRDLLVDRGYHEAITFSFVDPELHRRIVPNADPVRLANPIAANLAEMRTSLWPGLLDALRYNIHRQQGRVRIFEVGSIYLRDGAGSREDKRVGGLLSGAAYPEQWGTGKRTADFFDAKADVEAILGLTGNPGDFIFERGSNPALHPGQSAQIRNGRGEVVGQLGALHPQIQRELDLPQAVLVFELRLAEEALPVASGRFRELSRFPAIRRDLAVVVDEAVSAHAVAATVGAAAGALLRELQLFDVYRGEGIDSGRKSLALGLTLQDTLRTLKDVEVDAIIKTVLEQLGSKLGATLRE